MTAEGNPAWYIDPELDPVKEMLVIYDQLVCEILQQSAEIIVATGLSQQPYLTPTFYYRLRLTMRE